MRFKFLSLLLPALAAAALLTAMGSGPKNTEMQGQLAPAFELEDLQGERVNLASFGDKLVVLDFWAAWCQPCLRAIPDLNKLQTAYKDQIAVVGLSIDQRGRSIAAEAAQKHQIGYRVLIGNNTVADSYGVSAIPYLVAVKNGRIVTTMTGIHSYQEMVQALKLKP